jgi:Tfp pilus assembly protein FimT
MELILVMLVISVVLALSAPSLRGFFASRQTADAAMTMMSLTKYARSQAVAQGRRYRLNIDAASGTYWLAVQQGGAFVDLNSEMGRRFQLPEGATVSLRLDAPGSDAAYVQFYPNGRSDTATIEIRGRQGDVFLVTAPAAIEPFRVISPSEAPAP